MTSPSSAARQRKPSSVSDLNNNNNNTNPAAVPMSHFYGAMVPQQQYHQQHQQHMLLYHPRAGPYTNTAPASTHSTAAGVPLVIQYNHPHAPPPQSTSAGVAAALQDPTRKRQRRQTAGKLVMNALFGAGNNNSHGVPTTTTQPPAPAMTTSPPVTVPSNPTATTPTAPTTTPTTTTKKSKAQPRPAVYVAPRSIGPVRDPNPNDVLSGRGGRINAHAGNVQFREIVQQNKTEYLDVKTKKLEKAHIAAQIVYHIRGRNPPGRFLKEDPDGLWFDIGDQKAIKKVGQALREDAPELRGGDSDGKKAKDDSSASDAAEEPPKAQLQAPHESSKKKSDKKKVAEKKSPRKNVAASEVISALPGLTITAPPRSGGGGSGSAGDTTPRHHNYQPQQHPSGGANLIPPSSTSSISSSAKILKSPPSAGSGTATAVSSRGGKVATSSAPSSHRSSLEPVRGTVEIVLNPPPAYQQQQQMQMQHHSPVAPPSTSLFAASNSFRRRHHHKDGRSSGASVSGAAAAAMHDDHEFAEPEPRHMLSNHADEAFGMQFHPPNHNNHSNTLLMESSLLSGSVSDRPGGGGGGESSMLSGMSGISALTDPLSALSGTEHQRAAQARRLDQVRQYWTAAAASQNNTMNPPDPNSATIQMLQSSNGLGSSLLQMSVFEQLQQPQQQQSARGVFLADDAMSWTGRHSLVGSHNGGGSVTRDDSSIMYGATTSSQLSGGSGLGFSIGALSAGLRSEQEYNNMILQQQQQQQTYGSTMMDPLPVGNSNIAATGLPPMGRTNNHHLHPRNHSPFYNPSSSSSRGGGMRGMPAYHNHLHNNNNNYYYGGGGGNGSTGGGGPNLHDGAASIAASLTSDNSETMLSVLSENLHALDLADSSGHYNLGSNNSNNFPYSGNTYQI